MNVKSNWLNISNKVKVNLKNSKTYNISKQHKPSKTSDTLKWRKY